MTARSRLPIWPAPPQVVKALAGHTGPVNAVTFTPKGDQVVSGSADKTVQVWGVADGASKTKLEILLNPDEDDTIELLKALQEIDKSCTEAEFEERSAKMTTIARRLLKREWVRIKTELK